MQYLYFPKTYVSGFILTNKKSLNEIFYFDTYQRKVLLMNQT